MNNRTLYEAPSAMVLEVKFEGMICDSANKALGLSSGTGSSSLESRESSGTWGDGSWN